MGNVSKPKILCVEDDADTCELITAVLPEFDVVSVQTKNEAIEKAREGGFFVILMDYHLPDGTRRRQSGHPSFRQPNANTFYHKFISDDLDQSCRDQRARTAEKI